MVAGQFDGLLGSQLLAVAVSETWQVCAGSCDRWPEQQRQSGEDRQLKGSI